MCIRDSSLSAGRIRSLSQGISPSLPGTCRAFSSRGLGQHSRTASALVIRQSSTFCSLTSSRFTAVEIRCFEEKASRIGTRTHALPTLMALPAHYLTGNEPCEHEQVTWPSRTRSQHTSPLHIMRGDTSGSKRQCANFRMFAKCRITTLGLQDRTAL